MMVTNMMMYSMVKGVAIILYFIALFVFARMIRKANGGYIEFREIFGAVFVMLLVAGFMTYLYNYLYMYAIDPDFMGKMKASTLNQLEKMPGITDEQLDEQAKRFDKQIEESKNIGKSLLYFLGMLMFESLFGLIICAIVKKPRPMFETPTP